jgi:hypothetical protein
MQRERADTLLCHHERDHLTVQRAVVEAHDAVHADGHEMTRVPFEDRRAERPTCSAKNILTRDSNRETHLFFVRRISTLPVDDGVDPVRILDMNGGMCVGVLSHPVRSEGSAVAAIVADLRATIARAEPGVVLVSAHSVETLLDAPRAQPRLNAVVLGLFAGAALLLAAVGLFAVIATMVRQRTREMGIRMALGATAGDVRRMVMMRGLTLGVIGATIGIAGALATSRMLSALLFEISATDAPTLASVSVAILIVAAIASFVPARLTRRIDPIIALRNEG